VLAATALVAACGLSCQPAGEQEAAELVLELTIAPSPPRVGMANVELTLADASATAVEGATVRIEGNMNHAGMVPVFADAHEVAPGRYEAELELTMGGDWILLVEAELPDGRSQRWQEALPGVRPD
jgi:hypothetical protein